MRALLVGSGERRAVVIAALATPDVQLEHARDLGAVEAALAGAPVALVLVDADATPAAEALCTALGGLRALEAATLVALSDEPTPARLAALFAAGARDVVRLPGDADRLRARALEAQRRVEAPDLPLLYRSAFEHNPLAMCLVDDETLRFLAVSDGAVRAYGWSREEFAHMTLRDVRPPAAVPELVATLGKADPAFLATTHRRKDGSEFASHGLLQRLEVGGRRVRFAVSRDVTDEVRATEGHRRALAEYRDIVERTADGVFIHLASGNGDLAYANPGFAAFLGYDTPAPLVGRPVLELVHPQDRDMVRGRIASIVSTGKPSAPRELRFVDRDGAPRWAETRGSATTFDGAPAVLVIARDLTERHKADEALRTSEERFARIFQSNPAAITITRLVDGRLVDANRRFEEMTGFRRQDVVGKTALEVGMWSDPAERAVLLQALEQHGRVRDFEVRLFKRSGEPIQVSMSVEHVDVGGEPCVLALAIDVTERKELEAQLRHAQKMEAIGRLAGGIAHDFNNLLTGIRGYSELLAGELPAGSSERAAADHIRRAALRAASLTGQLLVFTRRQPMQPRVVVLDDVVRQTGALLGRIIGGDITLSVQLAGDGARVRVDPVQLEQVILNLAVNARDAMPSGGQLTIATGADAARRRAHLRVTDTGAGMTEEVRTRIFEPFFTTKEMGKGTGLGLSIVYGIVEQSGGTIGVVSAPGRGASFDIALPLADEAALPSPAPPPRAAVHSGHETILLVEDDEDVRDFAEFVLRRAGYEVLVAGDGAAALEAAAARNGDIQLVVSDVVMPRLNGRELAERLVATRPRLKVLHMSGYPGAGGVPADEAYSGAHFLQKPFSADELLGRVRAVLDGPVRRAP